MSHATEPAADAADSGVAATSGVAADSGVAATSATGEAAWPFPVADGDRCPCLSGEVYGDCCAPFHRGTEHAPTAERLMRSRYSAFVVGDAAYLLATWHPRTRPGSLELDPGIRWFRLDILSRTGGGLLDTEGTVEFRARYRMRAPAGSAGSPAASAAEQHENSRFVRVEKRWLYVDAV